MTKTQMKFATAIWALRHPIYATCQLLTGMPYSSVVGFVSPDAGKWTP